MNHHILDIFDYICAQNKYRYEYTNKIQGVYLAGEHHPQSATNNNYPQHGSPKKYVSNITNRFVYMNLMRNSM